MILLVPFHLCVRCFHLTQCLETVKSVVARETSETKWKMLQQIDLKFGVLFHAGIKSK